MGRLPELINDRIHDRWQSIDRLALELDTGGSQLRLCERYLLYALVRGLQPRVALEIGSAQGGSAQLICAAMDETGRGRLICVDPDFQFSDGVWRRVQHRVTRVTGATPGIMPDVVSALAGEPVNLAFIDGDHTFTGASDDIACVLPVLAPGAILLFHDSHHPPVRAAIDAALTMYPDRLSDVGELSAEVSTVDDSAGRGIWGGLRALRVLTTAGPARTAAGPDSSELIRELSDECSRLRQESKSLAVGFEERGARIRELEVEIRRVWGEAARVAIGFEERGRRVAELDEELRRVAESLRDAMRSGQEQAQRISELEGRRGRPS